MGKLLNYGAVPALSLVLSVSLLASPHPSPPSIGQADLLSLKQSVVANYADLVAATYGDALAGVRALDEAVEEFLAAPQPRSLNHARDAWIESRVSYAQTEAFRFYDGPIDAIEGLINSWPIDENLIDYVDEEPDAGIISQSNRFPRITSDLIVSLNENGGEKNITAGFHAIEFLLWGQDLHDDGPGRRSYLDYVDKGRAQANRRREYLHLTSRLLVQDLEQVVDAWSPDDPSNYRSRFLELPSDEAIAAIFKGIGILSAAELAGERLTVPYETKEQEDEHSCFSDNTQQDIVYNTLGIANVILGRYVRANGTRVEGPGVSALLAVIDAPLARKLVDQTETSLAHARAVPSPFDRAILGADSSPGRVTIKRLITALRAQADSIAHAGAALGLRLNF